MKPLLINSSDRGGAANACIRLHQGLLQQNIESKLLLQSKQKHIEQSFEIALNTINVPFSTKLKWKFKQILKELKLDFLPEDYKTKFIQSRPKGLEMFSFPNSIYDITKSELYKEADIINLHWVANFLDYKSFFQQNNKPVVWTLHDMNPFTGGEHYEEKYLGIDENGYPTERYISNKERNVIEQIIGDKAEILSNFSNLTIVTPSLWLSYEAKQSAIFSKFDVLTIPYGINEKIFKPRNKEYSRELLGIPNDKKVILFVADSISNHRKGFVYLKRAFEQLNRNDVVLCAIGSKSSELKNIGNVLELGTVYDERLMSIVYSMADVFVIPSLMDNLPNTVIESLMCGTPVIGFPIGGIPDMVKHGNNGLLANEISVAALKNSIEEFLETSDKFDRTKIAQDAKNKYSQHVQANKYINLYNEILM
jgi:glycosyltransferase involved in cell wall biosynthesis